MYCTVAINNPRTISKCYYNTVRSLKDCLRLQGKVNKTKCIQCFVTVSVGDSHNIKGLLACSLQGPPQQHWPSVDISNSPTSERDPHGQSSSTDYFFDIINIEGQTAMRPRLNSNLIKLTECYNSKNTVSGRNTIAEKHTNYSHIKQLLHLLKKNIRQNTRLH